MDLDEWELVPEEGYLEIHDDGGKKIFSRKYGKVLSNSVFKNYFISPSPKPHQKFVESSSEGSRRVSKQLVPVPIQLDPTVCIAATDHESVITEKIKALPNIGAHVEADQESVSQVFFKKMKENEFVDMKILDSPKSGRSIIPQIEVGTFQFEDAGKAMESNKNMMVEKEKIQQQQMLDSAADIMNEEEEEEEGEVTWEESNGGSNIWKWNLNGIGAICSFGIAAAAVCIIMFGSGQRNKQHQQNHQKIRFQIYADDKRMNQVVHHATKLNEAISSAVRGVPLTGAHITVGGYYDGL